MPLTIVWAHVHDDPCYDPVALPCIRTCVLLVVPLFKLSRIVLTPQVAYYSYAGRYSIAIVSIFLRMNYELPFWKCSSASYPLQHKRKEEMISGE